MDRRVITRELVAAVGRARTLEILGEFLTEARRARIEAVLGARLVSVAAAIEDPYDPHNAAAIVRTAEAVGLADVHAITHKGPVLRGRRTARGAFQWVRRHHHRGLEPFLAAVRARGMRIAAACVEDGMPLALSELPVDRPICVLLGNEHSGLSEEARAAADLRFQIPMHGMVESLNVSVAAAVALFDVGARRRRELGRDGDLDPEERADLRVSWYARSVDERLLAALARKHLAAQGST
ncbi:MAG: RNA methyltransferase [Myxococcales bacterium]|nr:RNA methyltransferase [Myxococcales bacterium]